MNMEKRIIKLGEQMLDELYKKSTPSITWVKFKKKYENKNKQGFEKHCLFQYEAEEILDKYKKKCKNIFERDSLSWLWLDFCPKNMPTPGSKDAIKQKCTCAVLDNSHGAAWFGKVHGFWVTEGCPLHSSKGNKS